MNNQGTQVTVTDKVMSVISAAKVTYPPTSWRLARRNGELILQAGSMWIHGRESGVEWNDVPTVNLDEPEVSG
jgi:hypothetical protein